MKDKIGGLIIALIVCTVLADRAYRFIPERTQHAQLLEIPEITEEVDTPQATVSEDPQVSPQPTPVPVQPSDVLREVQVEGPVDAIVGDPVYLRVRTEGPAVNYAWSIEPDVDGLFVLDDGSNAIFTNRNAREYTVFVSVVDQAGNLEQDTFKFELIQQKDTLTLQNLSQANPDPTVEELVDYYVSLVQSNDKERQVIIVSQTFRQTANLLRTGAIQPGSNFLGSMKKGLEVTMGPANFKKWNDTFFFNLETMLNDYAAKGYLNTREDWINTLDNLAAIMESRQSRKLQSPK
jgi:hypothetical protein